MIDEILQNLFGCDSDSIKLKIDISIPVGMGEPKQQSHSLIDYNHVYGNGDKSLSSLFDECMPPSECDIKDDKEDDDESGDNTTGVC